MLNPGDAAPSETPPSKYGQFRRKYGLLPELAVLSVLTLLQAAGNLSSGIATHHQAVPQALGLPLDKNSTGDIRAVSVNASRLSYPIRFGDTHCTPIDILKCVDKAPDGSAPETAPAACCEAVSGVGKDTEPYETVSYPRLLCFTYIVPTAALVLRWALCWFGTRSRSQPQLYPAAASDPATLHPFAACPLDLVRAVAALALECLLTVYITDVVKNCVGEPRPVFYALNLFADYGNDVSGYVQRVARRPAPPHWPRKTPD